MAVNLMILGVFLKLSKFSFCLLQPQSNNSQLCDVSLYFYHRLRPTVEYAGAHAAVSGSHEYTSTLSLSCLSFQQWGYFNIAEHDPLKNKDVLDLKDEASYKEKRLPAICSGFIGLVAQSWNFIRIVSYIKKTISFSITRRVLHIARWQGLNSTCVNFDSFPPSHDLKPIRTGSN